MNKMIKLLRSAMALGYILSFVALAGADIMGPAYPAPGGNTWSSSGLSAAHSGGINYIYSAFDPNAFTDLYWGAWDATTTGASLEGFPLHNLSTAGVNGNTAKWTGTTGWFNHDVYPNGQYYPAVPIELNITMTGTGSWVLASSLGLAGRSDYLWDTSHGQNYTANIQFLADVGSGMIPLDEIPVVTYGNMQSSFYGGFFSTPAVPEPCTFVLMGMGAFSLIIWRRRKQIA